MLEEHNWADCSEVSFSSMELIKTSVRKKKNHNWKTIVTIIVATFFFCLTSCVAFDKQQNWEPFAFSVYLFLCLSYKRMHIVYCVVNAWQSFSQKIFLFHSYIYLLKVERSWEMFKIWDVWYKWKIYQVMCCFPNYCPLITAMNFIIPIMAVIIL